MGHYDDCYEYDEAKAKQVRQEQEKQVDNTTKVYQINEAGLYAIGHFNTCVIRLYLGCPDTCLSIELTQNKLLKLMELLKLDFEDGTYVGKALVGQHVLVYFDESHHVQRIGDVFGHHNIEIRD